MRCPCRRAREIGPGKRQAGPGTRHSKPLHTSFEACSRSTPKWGGPSPPPKWPQIVISIKSIASLGEAEEAKSAPICPLLATRPQYRLLIQYTHRSPVVLWNTIASLRQRISDPMRAHLRTLIVDDNSTNLKILERTLKHHFSHLVDVNRLVQAADGFRALEAYESGSFDMILCDIDMPGLSGVQVARKIRETDSDIIFIACTTSDSPSARQLYADTGMDACVCKPLDLIELNESITTALHDRRNLFDLSGSPELYQRYLIHRESVSSGTDKTWSESADAEDYHTRDCIESPRHTAAYTTQLEDPLRLDSDSSDGDYEVVGIESDSSEPELDVVHITADKEPGLSVTEVGPPVCACARLRASIRARMKPIFGDASIFEDFAVATQQTGRRPERLLKGRASSIVKDPATTSTDNIMATLA